MCYGIRKSVTERKPHEDKVVRVTQIKRQAERGRGTAMAYSGAKRWMRKVLDRVWETHAPAA